jgi:cell wall-associated NlpC family hydrolase
MVVCRLKSGAEVKHRREIDKEFGLKLAHNPAKNTNNRGVHRAGISPQNGVTIICSMKPNICSPLLLSLSLALFGATAGLARADDLTKLLIDKGLVSSTPAPKAEDAGHLSLIADRTDALLSSALNYIGIPYKRGGSNEDLGFDCSGFVQNLYSKTFGMILPRSAVEQAQATTPIDKQELQPGDLVFFNTMRRAFSHVGVYLGDGKFIHAPRAGSKVRVESMKTSYWEKRFNGARRVQDRD